MLETGNNTNQAYSLSIRIHADGFSFYSCNPLTDKGFKKVKTLKPGKKLTMTKFKKKAFKTGKTYYIRIQVKTKKNITCGNYYQGYVYFYRTLRF